MVLFLNSFYGKALFVQIFGKKITNVIGRNIKF